MIINPRNHRPSYGALQHPSRRQRRVAEWEFLDDCIPGAWVATEVASGEIFVIGRPAINETVEQFCASLRKELRL